MFVSGPAKSGDALWRCINVHWEAAVYEYGNIEGDALAVIETAVGDQAAASEVADGIKTVYRPCASRSERRERVTNVT